MEAKFDHPNWSFKCRDCRDVVSRSQSVPREFIVTGGLGRREAMEECRRFMRRTV
jgi:hypothetical protein